jgi:hypothetical protein
MVDRCHLLFHIANMVRCKRCFNRNNTSMIRHPSFWCSVASALFMCTVETRGQQEQVTTTPAETTEVNPALETNPAVRAALEWPRREPADYLRAISWLLDLDRPELAKPILDELRKLQLTDTQRSALVTEFGSRSMLQIARAKELAPGGEEFANACMAAAAAAAKDATRIAELVTQLTEGPAETRQTAMADLAATGQAGATAVLEAAARETNSDKRNLLLLAAAQMRPFAVGPLLAMLTTRNASLREAVAQLLTNLQVSQAAPLLAATTDSAESLLVAAIEKYRRGTAPFAVDEANQVELWHWDDAEKKLTSARYPAEEAKKLWIARLARELVGLHPDNQQYLQEALVLELEVAALAPPSEGLKALNQLATLDTSLLNSMLAEALAENYARAAVALADAVGQRADAAVLYAPPAKLSPLVEALASPNRSVRFAALRAIITLNPTSPYPGSSRVPEALLWFASSKGARGAVVGMPTLEAATNLAGMLAGLNIEAVAANRGRDVVETALAMSDLEFMFVDMNIIVPDVRQVLYELRTHATTAEIPIALMATEGRLAAAEKLATEHQRVVAVSRPHSQQRSARIVEQLTASSGGAASAPEERMAQAAQARDWLEKLRTAGHSFYRIPSSQVGELGARSASPRDESTVGDRAAPAIPRPVP